MLRALFENGGEIVTVAWRWFPILGFWLICGWNLSVHWSANPNYSYGWLVPGIGMYALWGRWRTRPEPGYPVSGAGWVLAVAGFVFLPSWTFAQPNPDWSLIAWLLTAEVVGMTLAGIAIAGGWSWVRHFAFPICLIFTAVPCPHVIDIPMTVGLMHGVASFTVELLNICNVAAVQHGNVIEVRGGLLGVDQACSGVRSLQAALTSSLFIGEMFRFRPRGRFILVGVGLVAALVTNVIRTFFLSWTTSREGLLAVDKWHDPAGFFILSVCFLAIWMAAVWMAKGVPSPKHAGVGVPGRPLPGRLMMGLSIWMLAVLAMVEMWFHDDASAPESPWSLLPPTDSEPVRIGEDAVRQLRCDQLKASAWREADGSEWIMYFLQWRPGPIRSRVLARVHRPDVCLSSIGLKLVHDRGTLIAEAGGYKLPFRAYTFEREGRLMYVYYGLWQTRSQRAEARGALSESEHVAGFQAVMWRERNLGQQVAEFAVTGCADAVQADARFQEVLKKLLVRRLPTSIGG